MGTELFAGWEETIIWSCLQGIMGQVRMNDASDAAMARLGDFAFFAGVSDEELLKSLSDNQGQDFLIVVPQNDEWAQLIEKCYGEKAGKVTRYAMKKEKDIFEVSRLEQAATQLAEGYELRMIEECEYDLCKQSDWAKDLVSQFKDYDAYKNLGLGVVALKDGNLAAGASSYSRYAEGIEIEVDTKQEHRRKGLAYACSAKLVLECLRRGLYPSWDAQNLHSVALAEKLGYHFSHEYTAYEVTGLSYSK
jgi:GNAT superfamily N-acetyltransferase